MNAYTDETDRSLVVASHRLVNWQEIIAKQSRVNRNLELPSLVNRVESGKWPSPQEIDLLRAEVENMTCVLQIPLSRQHDFIEIELERDDFILVSKFAEHCKLMVRMVSGLAALARFSLRDTVQLFRQVPLAWCRLRAEASIYQTLSNSDSEQNVQVQSPTLHKPNAWPGCKDWHNWGIGVDAAGRWHLFHFHRSSENKEIFGWRLHRHARVHIASGAMEQAARTFVTKGRLELHRQRDLKQLKSTISRLRSAIKAAVAKEGFRPEGALIVSPTKDHRAWTPIVKFGTVVNRERHREFVIQDF